MISRIAAVALIILVSSLSTGGERGRFFVLVYHSFLGNSEYPTDISLAELKIQLGFFKQNGFAFVTFSDISRDRVSGSKNILVSVDDGNRSFHRTYSEVFRPMGIRPLIAIYPHVIGHSPRALTWEQLKEMAAEGCEIASHGYYHLYVDRKLYDTNRASFMREIYESKAELEKKLARRITVFVYPYGVRSGITRTILREARYTHAFTLRWGPVFSPPDVNQDSLELPRYMHMSGNWNMITGHIIKNTNLK